jgi:hypothetical protein
MAIGVKLNFVGATLEQYDEIVAKMGYLPGGPAGPGAISHLCTKTDDGFRVIDVWESKDAFERFAQEKIGPLSGAVGLGAPPEIKFFDIHNYLTPG